ncbi:DUF2271 domain-containing protein [Thalassotalea marina]|uniref:DUF2271 domain-containing protein n=1 Tax=Thalassotalea marina TaxID=1673741 RepID=A0A919BAN1_9GAMM|nr:DUF2271 domain-containing protein [Thalassotalea marina]GHF77761.1 hypothetical protein GCM10017161_00930 [Thalassotalea marina]
MLKLSNLILIMTFLSCAFIAKAQDKLQLEVNIPRLQVAEYHKPYVAIWLEDSQRKVTQVAVWYDVEMENKKGEEWLADLRQWWRKGGRKLALPVDGVTGATKGPGSHVVTLDLSKLLTKQAPGQYKLRVEAAREVGGRELIEIPVELPLNPSNLPLTASGKSELGKVQLTKN